MIDGIIIGTSAVVLAIGAGYGTGYMIGWIWNKVDDWRYR